MKRHIIGVLLLLLCSSVCAATHNASVTRSADDAKVYGDHLETGEHDALIGNTGSYRCDYLARFDNLILAAGITVDSAFLSLQASTSQSGSACDALIRAEDTADASSFSTFSDYDARNLTGDAVEWDDMPPTSAASWYHTPDIGDVIQEVVDRADWNSGNAMAVFIIDDSSTSGAYRRFYQYDNDSTDACSLIVYYRESAGEQIMPSRRRVVLSSACDSEMFYTGWDAVESRTIFNVPKAGAGWVDMRREGGGPCVFISY